MCLSLICFFKQKPAFEMRISDWSSDGCSSDLFLPLVAKLADRLPKSLRVVVMTDRGHMPESVPAGAPCYEELLAGQTETIVWPEFDANSAAGLCSTSGTTRNPQGVLYSPRSTLLHPPGVLVVGAPIGLRP